MQDNVISFIGTYHHCRHLATPPCTEYNLAGHVVLPAFTDTHTHFVEYAKARLLVNLDKCHSIPDIIDYLKQYRQNLSWNPQWILGGGWNRNILAEPNMISKELLDNIFPDIPVALFSRDYHAKWCNSLAFDLCHIDDKTPQPPGGKIEHDASGMPTGVLFETATDIIEPFIVQAPASEIIKAIKATVNDIYPHGIIGFHSMEYEASANLLTTAQAQGSLFRCCWHFQANELDVAIKKGLLHYQDDDWFKIGGIKLFGDGSLGSGTAAMFNPYSDEPHNTGILRYTDEELFHTMENAAKSGFGSTIHAIGDRCVNQVINATLKLNQNPNYHHLLHRLEHVQSIQESDIPALKQSGLFLSLQPVHLANDIPMLKTKWHEVNAYPFNSLISNDLPYSFGSDTPIETMNPFLGIYTALERKEQCNPQNPSWQPNQKLNIHQAIFGYTQGAAMSSRSHKNQGSIQLGNLADLMVLKDFRHLPNEYWLHAETVMTMVNGVVVHGGN